MDTINKTLKQFIDLLSYIFRHIIPGIIIILLAFLYFPAIFSGFDPKEKYHVISLGVIAISIGNLMYAIHRFTLHQFLDFLYHQIYYTFFEGDKKTSFFKRLWLNFENYFEWMSEHMVNYYKLDFEEKNKELFRLSHNKSAQLITLFITFETIIVFDYIQKFIGRHNSELCHAAIFPKILFIAWSGLVFCLFIYFIPWIMNVKFIKKL